MAWAMTVNRRDLCGWWCTVRWGTAACIAWN